MLSYRTDFFTPPNIAEKLIEQHKKYSVYFNNVLEPSAGVGNLL